MTFGQSLTLLATLATVFAINKGITMNYPL